MIQIEVKHPRDAFGRFTESGRPSYHALRQRDYRARDPEANRSRQAQWYHDNRNQALAAQKALRQKVRQKVLAAYGGKCTCCGETTPEFLTLDHVNGGGNEHRRHLPGKDLWRWSYSEGFPDILQLLCYNCNGAKAADRTCPHQLKRDDGQDQA